MAIHFFDSCALQHRYIPSTYSAPVDAAVDSVTESCYIAEWSILEMASALANRVRQGSLPLTDFDALNNRFLGDVAAGKLQVFNISARHYIRSRNLIRFAGVVKKRNLKSGDAMVATLGQALAMDQRERVKFYTSDWRLYDILRDIDAFTSQLELIFLGLSKSF